MTSEAVERAALTPMSDHVARFWRLLKDETVYISVNIRRDHEDGIPHYDTSQFSSEAAKALVADRAALAAQGEAEPVGDAYDPTTQPYDDPFRHVDKVSTHAVRPLEWEEREEKNASRWHDSGEISYWADHQFGFFAIERDYFSAKPWELLAGGRIVGRFDTVDEAKIAAQANFSERILSCLYTRPTPPADAVRVAREALEDIKMRTQAWGGETIDNAAARINYAHRRADAALALLSKEDQ